MDSDFALLRAWFKQNAIQVTWPLELIDNIEHEWDEMKAELARHHRDFYTIRQIVG